LKRQQISELKGSTLIVRNLSALQRLAGV